MIGIYKITNLINGKSYIGQSKNIEHRFKEHMYHSQTDLDKDIHIYGLNNFSFDILEICEIDQLDEKEAYYINLYDTRNTGYNIIAGGIPNHGEANPNAKLTEKDVYYIRECYNNHMDKREVYKEFSNKISWLYFSNLWEGVGWENVHYDVYTEENRNYYISGRQTGQDAAASCFTNLEVFELRKRYINETAEEIYESVKDKCTFQTLQCILWGRYYSQMIVYSKKNKKWIRK